MKSSRELLFGEDQPKRKSENFLAIKVCLNLFTRSTQEKAKQVLLDSKQQSSISDWVSVQATPTLLGRPARTTYQLDL